MASKTRLTRLEKTLNPDPGKVYILIDSQGKYWVNDKTYTEAEFNQVYHNAEVRAVKVGIDLGRL